MKEEEQKSKEEEHRRYLEKADKELELLREKKSNKEHDGQRTQATGLVSSKRPKLPKFEKDKDDMDAYLERFERYPWVQGWDREEWAVDQNPNQRRNGLNFGMSQKEVFCGQCNGRKSILSSKIAQPTRE